jgi:hypothetical protein
MQTGPGNRNQAPTDEISKIQRLDQKPLPISTNGKQSDEMTGSSDSESESH